MQSATPKPPSTGRATLYYTLARLALFVALGGILFFAGLRGFLLIAVDALLSGILSYVLLAPQREAMALGVARRLEARRGEKADLRRELDEGS